MNITSDDFNRLENKVDKMADAINRLVIIEERQSTQGQRIGAVESKMAAVEMAVITNDRKVDQWINRGIGVWIAVAMSLSIGTAIYKAVV